MLADALTRKLRERFPDMKMVFGAPLEAVVVIPSAHPDVGDIQIFVHGSETIFMVGEVTHLPLGDPEFQEEDDQLIVAKLIDFLERLFADQIVLWSSHKRGGWYDRQRVDPAIAEFRRLMEGKKLYVWSGPLDR